MILLIEFFKEHWQRRNFCPLIIGIKTKRCPLEVLVKSTNKYWNNCLFLEYNASIQYLPQVLYLSCYTSTNFIVSLRGHKLKRQQGQIVLDYISCDIERIKWELEMISTDIPKLKDLQHTRNTSPKTLVRICNKSMLKRSSTQTVHYGYNRECSHDRRIDSCSKHRDLP